MTMFRNFFHSNKNQVIISGTLLAILISASVSYFVGLKVQEEKYAHFLQGFRNIRENSDKYNFINPLIGGASPPATDVGIFTDIKEDIVSYLADEEKKGNLYDYSFYFRDIGTSFWFGANEATTFFPASLFKLPIALAVYKEGENDPTFLKRIVVYTQDLSNANTSVQENSQTALVVGKTYSIEGLVEMMLTTSDNGAKDLLLGQLNKTYLNQLFEVVALIDPLTVRTYEISSQKYALFLRVLYGSSYLNEEHSELILKILSKSTFDQGLIAGVPGNVPIAHKYGAYEFEEEINGEKVLAQQLHDCGIVYHAEKPYIFCFMTKGKDAATLYQIISHMSKMIYDYQEREEGSYD